MGARDRLIDSAVDLVRRHGFTAGCPIVAAALAWATATDLKSAHELM
jgi:hypothetical protein